MTSQFPSYVSTERCSLCPTYAGYSPKPIPTHRYGDYVVLKPDAASRQKLQQLAQKASSLIQTEVGLYPEELTTFDADKMHLTLAMPLSPMNKSEATQLINKIKTEVDGGPITFDVVFKGPKEGGSFGFSFTSPNYAPGFDIRLREPQVELTGRSNKKAHQKMVTLASKIQNFCYTRGLVDSNKNTNGKCNNFNPHISLGKLGNRDASKQLHRRQAHRSDDQHALSHLMSKAVATMNGGSIMPLQFNKVEILRVDSLENHTSATHQLASLDLNSKKTTIKDHFPSCSHVGDNHDHESKESAIDYFSPGIPSVESSSESTQDTSIDYLYLIRATLSQCYFNGGYKLGLGKVLQGDTMVEARFDRKEDAENLLGLAAIGQDKAKVHQKNGKFIVNLGPERFNNLFLDTGPEYYKGAIAELKGSSQAGSLQDITNKASSSAKKSGKKQAASRKGKKVSKKERKQAKKAAPKTSKKVSKEERKQMKKAAKLERKAAKANRQH